MHVIVLVELLMPDPAAMTAAAAIRRRLDMPELRSLRRRVCIELSAPDDTGAAFPSSVRAVLDHSIVIANPNKETTQLVADAFELSAPGALVWDLMHDAIDRALPARAARVRPELQGMTARRAVLWTAEWSGAGDAEARLRRIAVGDGRGGLLVNPHANGIEYVHTHLVPGDIERCVSQVRPLGHT